MQEKNKNETNFEMTVMFNYDSFNCLQIFFRIGYFQYGLTQSQKAQRFAIYTVIIYSLQYVFISLPLCECVCVCVRVSVYKF